ncbi:hypothetical protein GCM10007874_24220 [Labrys miyagiensis]|uniref:Uncharacterized protein n=1 Tax=Labrys miyagiensis TaxID=346912 RepID=A0ABQ6CKK1_9HYPH|nr:hypothetical protein [Labrys miyagiensis]GLS19405.1 hypothetical protein GCM10007874_24220 [Labrys miyagiensis]
MKFSCRSLLLSVAVTLAAGGLSQAQTVKLIPQPDLAEGIASFPHLAPEAPYAAKINAALDKIQSGAPALANDCKTDSGESAFERSIDVTMQGPRFVSFVVQDEFSCGAHPDSSQAAFVYDLTTGKPVDWPHLLPPAMAGKAVRDTADADVVVGLLRSPVLTRAYVESLKASGVSDECNDVYDQTEFRFMLWPDAREHGLVLDQNGLPHVAQACGGPVTLSLDKLRKLGVDRKLIDAIAVGQVAQASQASQNPAKDTADASSGNAADSLVGTYERKSKDKGDGTIKVEKAGSKIRMTFQVGGVPNGGATAADCGFIAEGEVKAGVFTGNITRTGVLEGLDPEGEAAEAGLAPVTAAILDRQILVTQAPAGTLCGGGNEVTGGFMRTGAR